MFEHINLDFEFHITTGELNIITNYDDSVLIKNYYVSNTDEVKEWFSVYSTGLVIYTKQLAGEVTTKSNMKFEMNDNQEFVLVSE